MDLSKVKRISYYWPCYLLHPRSVHQRPLRYVFVDFLKNNYVNLFLYKKFNAEPLVVSLVQIVTSCLLFSFVFEFRYLNEHENRTRIHTINRTCTICVDNFNLYLGHCRSYYSFDTGGGDRSPVLVCQTPWRCRYGP